MVDRIGFENLTDEVKELLQSVQDDVKSQKSKAESDNSNKLASHGMLRSLGRGILKNVIPTGSIVVSDKAEN